VNLIKDSGARDITVVFIHPVLPQGSADMLTGLPVNISSPPTPSRSPRKIAPNSASADGYQRGSLLGRSDLPRQPGPQRG
jgi:hypothetical protein